MNTLFAQIKFHVRFLSNHSIQSHYLVLSWEGFFLLDVSLYSCSSFSIVFGKFTINWIFSVIKSGSFFVKVFLQVAFPDYLRMQCYHNTTSIIFKCQYLFNVLLFQRCLVPLVLVEVYREVAVICLAIHSWPTFR